MAVIRCPKHDIPYNDRNPRGCPACFAETEGEDANSALMRELARASRAMPRPASIEILPPPAADEEPPQIPWPPPVTTQPRVPVPEPTRWEKLVRWTVKHRNQVIGAGLLGIAGFLIWIITRPEFIREADPPVLAVTPRPVPIEPNMPLDGVFARLGPAPPLLNEDSRTLARYSYGSGVHVDGFNNIVYAVTLTAVDRTWRGLRAGASESGARASLALLGSPTEHSPTQATPIRIRGFLVYASRDARPRRSLITEVRPPNGCYDVQIDLAPQIIGRLRQDDGTMVVVARRGGAMTWVAIEVRVVSRSLPGPYAGPAECALP